MANENTNRLNTNDPGHFKNGKDNVEWRAGQDISDVLEEVQCPYTDLNFIEVWKKLSNKEKKRMKQNIRQTDDGEVEVIPMKKKFSLLTAEHNEEEGIFSGDNFDKEKNIGIPGITYFTGEAAEKVCKEQGKKLLESEEQVKELISYFPGKDEKQRVVNFAILFFGFKKPGYRIPRKHWIWKNVDETGYAILSQVVGQMTYGVKWYHSANHYRLNGRIDGITKSFCQPVVAFKNCA